MTFINGNTAVGEAGGGNREGAQFHGHALPIQKAPKAAPSGAAFAFYASKISALWGAFAGYGAPDND